MTAPSSRPLQVGVVGLGVGEQHARMVASLPNASLSWVCDLDAVRADALARELGASVVPSFDALLSNPECDVVVLATFDDQHADQVVRALSAGKHVFCEKPLCRTAEELKRIRTVHASARKSLAVNLVLRSSPLFSWLFDACRSGELGTIYSVDAEYWYGRLDKITQGWRSSVPDYSVIAGGGVHVIDLMLGVLGEFPNAVTSIGNRIVTKDTMFQYPDFVASIFEFPSDVIGRVTANFGCVHKHQHVLRIFGDRGTFLFDDQGARIYRERDPGGPAERPSLSAAPPGKGALLPSFLADVHAGSYDAEREFELVAACLAADRALTERARVEVLRQ